MIRSVSTASSAATSSRDATRQARLIMLGAMWRMFKERQKTLLMAGALAVVLVGGFSLARTETFVGDKGSLDPMMPHHSRALLVCEESNRPIRRSTR